VNSGYVTMTDSLFTGNRALNGKGGGLSIEKPTGSQGPAFAWVIDTSFNGNSAQSQNDVYLDQNGLTAYVGTSPILNKRVFVPLAMGGSNADSARITDITIGGMDGSRYLVNFTTQNFVPSYSGGHWGEHVHFFFNTVPATQAGVPGAGPWYAYSGTSPFQEWGLVTRPPHATQLCILVAEHDHRVRQGTGNCVDLP
jgi:hypothetical protein